MSGGVSVSPLLELLELLELESSPGSLGGAAVGNGWSVSAEFLVGAGLAESGGVAAGLLGSPGNGNCSEMDGFFASDAGGVQGLEVVCGDGWV